MLPLITVVPLLSSLMCCLLFAFGVATPFGHTAATGPYVEPELLAQKSLAGTMSYLIYLKEQPDLTEARAMPWADRGRFVADRLRAAARKGQARVLEHLQQRGVVYRSFWIDNIILVLNSDRQTFEELRAFDEVKSIRARRRVRLVTPVGSGAPDGGTLGTEWNIVHVYAEKVWQMGFTGRGIVVANIDTGVRYTHNALVKQYRGFTPAGFDHNFNWWDPSTVCGSPSLAPCDNHGHGTHTMGIAVGGDGTLNRIGVAPGAQWIACKGCEYTDCSDQALLECGQFIAAPWNLDNTTTDPSKRPHIVNNSWGGDGGDDWYQGIVDNWLASGIYPVFSNGNTGPECGTVGSPGDYGNVSGVGATDASDAPADFSSRGPSVFENTLNPFGFPFLKPQVSAPGVDIRSAGNASDSSYTYMRGTSMAAPHVSGLVALMWSAASCLVRDYANSESIIVETAVAAPFATGCGDGPGNVPNQATGWGIINAQQAVMSARNFCGIIPGIKVSREGSGSGVVKSLPPAINCGPQCFAELVPGKTVRLTATPSSDSLFQSWSGACTSTSRTCVLTTDGTLQEVTAHFTSEPVIKLSTEVINFGSVKKGWKALRFLTVRNKGKKDLVVGPLAVSSGGAFSIQPLYDKCSGRTLPPGFSCAVRIDFAPAATGLLTGILDVPSNDPGRPVAQVSLSGTGR